MCSIVTSLEIMQSSESSVKHQPWIYCGSIIIAPDGREAIVGGQDGKLHKYSLSGDNLTEAAVLEKHRGAISVIQCSPDVTMFTSADPNREVVLDRASKESA